FLALAQGWKINGDNVQTVEEIFAKLGVANMLPEIDGGGSDDADINLNFVHPAQMHELAVLKDAKNFALGVEGHGADLVEKQGAAIGDFKQALLGGDGAGKRAFDVP